MKSAENIEKLIKNLDWDIDINPEKDRVILGELSEVHEKSKKMKSALVEPKIRRTIMKNPMTKLAAAAVIVIAVTLGLFEFSGTGNTSGVVWSQVMEKTEQISALAYDMTVEIDQPGGENLVLLLRNYVARDYGTRADTYIYGKLSKITYILPNQKVGYRVYVDRKKYRRYELSDAEMARGRDPEELTTCLKNIQSGGGYTELGRAEINGVVVEGVECNGPDMGGEDCFMRLWVDVETNLPVQIIMEMLGKEGGQMRPHKYLMENFEWNASLDEHTFEPNIPDDYTLIEDPRAGRDQQENSKAQQASPRTLTEQERAEQPKVKEAVRRFFNAFTEQDWDTVSKYLPDLKMSQRTKDILAGLETIYIGEPAKATNGNKWLIPYEIKFKNGGSQKNTMRLTADENTGQFIVRGGF
jgi:outer membrane lipoprotein-sorting protein